MSLPAEPRVVITGAGGGLDRLAEDYLRRGLAIVNQVHDLPAQIWVLENMGHYFLGKSRFTESQAPIAQAIEMSRSLADRRRWGESIALQVIQEYYQGNFLQCAKRSHEQYAANKQSCDHQGQFYSLLALIDFTYLPLGQLEQARQNLQECAGLLNRNIPRNDQIWYHGLRALVEWEQGERAAAGQAARAALRLLSDTSPTTFYTFGGYAAVAEVGLALLETQSDASSASANQQLARQACRHLSSLARPFPICRPRTWLYQGHHAWLRGHRKRAHKTWEQSLLLAEQQAMPYEQGRVHFAIGRHSQGPTRRHHLTRALEIFTRLGATYYNERARQELSK